MVVHFRNLRFRNNAGMDFPQCYSNADLLDLDKGRLPTTGVDTEVTCKRCLRYLKKKKGN